MSACCVAAAGGGSVLSVANTILCLQAARPHRSPALLPPLFCFFRPMLPSHLTQQSEGKRGTDSCWSPEKDLGLGEVDDEAGLDHRVLLGRGLRPVRSPSGREVEARSERGRPEGEVRVSLSTTGECTEVERCEAVWGRREEGWMEFGGQGPDTLGPNSKWFFGTQQTTTFDYDILPSSTPTAMVRSSCCCLSVRRLGVCERLTRFSAHHHRSSPPRSSSRSLPRSLTRSLTCRSCST